MVEVIKNITRFTVYSIYLSQWRCYQLFNNVKQGTVPLWSKCS